MTEGIPIAKMQQSWSTLLWPALLPWRTMSELRKRRSRLYLQEQRKGRAMAAASVADVGTDVANFLQLPSIQETSSPSVAVPPSIHPASHGAGNMPLIDMPLIEIDMPLIDMPLIDMPLMDDGDEDYAADHVAANDTFEQQEMPPQHQQMPPQQMPQQPQLMPPPQQMPRQQTTEPCPICHESFGECDDVRFIYLHVCVQCEKNVHVACLQRWVQQRNSNHTCPMCRFPIPLQIVNTWTSSCPSIHDLAALGVAVSSATDLGGILVPDAAFDTLDSIRASVRRAVEMHPAWEVLGMARGARFMLALAGVEGLNFQPYVEAISSDSSKSRRILALLACNESGHSIVKELAESAQRNGHRRMHGTLEDALFLTTMPLWLESSGSEIVPNVIAHETMLKNDDVYPVKSHHKSEDLVFLNEAELAKATADGTDDELVARLRKLPLWSALISDFHVVASDALIAVEQPLLRLAAAFYLSLISANAANVRSAEALGIVPAAKHAELKGRIVNFHQPHWLNGPASRMLLNSTDGVATTDSIPLILKSMDVDEAVQQIGREQMAVLYHAFLDFNRGLFRHIRHPQTRVHNDSASDAKNLCILYETGVLSNHPLKSDVLKYLSGLGTSAYVSHVMSSVQMVLTGYTRTATSYDKNPKRIPSDHLDRFIAATFVFLGNYDGLVVTGGITPPGVVGGSPNGKSPIPNHLHKSDNKCEDFEQGILCAIQALQNARLGACISQQVGLRPIFPDWCSIQTLQASDYVALTSMVYKFSFAARVLFASRMLFHACGPPPAEFSFPPPFPPDIAAQYPSYLSNKYLAPPPIGLWPSAEKPPRWPKTALSAAGLVQWWKGAHVGHLTYESMWDGGAFLDGPKGAKKRNSAKKRKRK